MMKFRMILAVLAIVASTGLNAQNATKAELNALSQRVAKLEADLERVVTENVNLVEQLNVKTVTSVTDKNGIQWDIVKVEPNEAENDVILTLRLTNNSGVVKSIGTGFDVGKAIDSNSNRNNNCYNVKIGNHNLNLQKIAAGVPMNLTVVIKDVPTTCVYLADINIKYLGYGQTKDSEFKFSGVHIPW